MKQTSFPFTLGIPVGALLALLGSDLTQDPQTAPSTQAPANGLKVGVVDFVQVFQGYPAYTKAEQDIKELFEQHQKRLDQEKARMDELEIRIKKMDPETRERAELELSYKLLSDQIKGMRDIYEVEIERARYQAIVDGYAEIEKAIHQVAKDQGVQLVLRQRKDPGTDSLIVRQKAYEQRNVWHADETLDLTQPVISFLKVSPANQEGDR